MYFNIAPFSPTAKPFRESINVRSKIIALSGVSLSSQVTPLSDVIRNLYPEADHPSVPVLKSIVNERPDKVISSYVQFAPASVVLIFPVPKKPSGSPESPIVLSESRMYRSKSWSGLIPAADQFSP